jgi:hypothetical protein
MYFDISSDVDFISIIWSLLSISHHFITPQTFIFIIALLESTISKTEMGIMFNLFIQI